MSSLGPVLFVGLVLLLAVAVGGVAIAVRVRGQRSRWGEWQQLAAARGLAATEGDPLGLTPLLSGPRRQRIVRRTLSGTLSGVPVAVVVTTGIVGGPHHRQARSDVLGVARVRPPVDLARVQAQLRGSGDVELRSVGDLLLLEPVQAVRLAVELPPASVASRLLDLAVAAGRAASS